MGLSESMRPQMAREPRGFPPLPAARAAVFFTVGDHFSKEIMMKAVMLAAGIGARLGPAITEHPPKVLHDAGASQASCNASGGLAKLPCGSILLASRGVELP